MPDFTFEHAAGCIDGRLVAGIDEVGRGPLAGPVVACAVILDATRLPMDLALRIDDSKALRPVARRELFLRLQEHAQLGIGAASVEEIDGLNILAASLLAMRRAVESLPVSPDVALVDGNQAPDLRCPARTVVKGDQLSLSIAAASIIAKVTRDRIMADLAQTHPGYGWERNAGYGTAEHRAALERLGATPEHRRSFLPVRQCLSRQRQGPDSQDS
ncbi:ribonuclease HII [Rhodospirillaceae bacterium SYSU D60014]|uniref:ribonuclease HII n=1 Tax=Virgifigura deserti TaxID=2268457 RepID=UPI0013C519EC